MVATRDYSVPPGTYETLAPAQWLNLRALQLKWGAYCLTGKQTQLYVQGLGVEGWVEVETPVVTKQKKLLRQLYPDSVLHVLPFNRQDRGLVRRSGPNYSIVDFVSGREVWRDQGRYEAPTIDFGSDLLRCHGDLDFTDYTFDSSGNLK